MHTEDTRLGGTEDTSPESVTCHVNLSLSPQLDGVACSIAVRIAICIHWRHSVEETEEAAQMSEEEGGGGEGSLLCYTRSTGPP